MPSTIWVNVKPNARQESIEKISASEYTVRVRAPAREGQANEAVIALLAERFSRPKSSVRIVRGEKSKRKLVQIL
jgi:uncharacterized protein (TIGR00251 family)